MRDAFWPILALTSSQMKVRTKTTPGKGKTPPTSVSEEFPTRSYLGGASEGTWSYLRAITQQVTLDEGGNHLKAHQKIRAFY